MSKKFFGAQTVQVVVQPGNLSYPYGIKGVFLDSQIAYDYVEELQNTHGGAYAVVPTEVMKARKVKADDD